MRSKTYESQLTVTPKALVELCWLKENLILHIAIGRPVKVFPPELIISSDAAGGLKRVGGSLS